MDIQSLRETAHKFLSENERCQFKNALKLLRETKDIHQLVISISNFITCEEKIHIIVHLARMMKPEAKFTFLHLCYEIIDVYRPEDYQELFNNNIPNKSALKQRSGRKSSLRKPLVHFSQDSDSSLSASQPDIQFRNYDSLQSKNDKYITKAKSVDEEVNGNGFYKYPSESNSSFCDYSLSPMNNRAKILKKEVSLPTIQEPEVSIKFSDKVKVFSHYNTLAKRPILDESQRNDEINNNTSRPSSSETYNGNTLTSNRTLTEENHTNHELNNNVCQASVYPNYDFIRGRSVTMPDFSCRNNFYLEHESELAHFPLTVTSDDHLDSYVITSTQPTLQLCSKGPFKTFHSVSCQCPPTRSIPCQTD